MKKSLSSLILGVADDMTITYPVVDVISDEIERNKIFFSSDALPLGVTIEHKDYGELNADDLKIVMVYKNPRHK